MVQGMHLNRETERQVSSDELSQHPRNNQVSDAPTPNTSLTHRLRRQDPGGWSGEDSSAG